jgi:hypothetical protein
MMELKDTAAAIIVGGMTTCVFFPVCFLFCMHCRFVTLDVTTNEDVILELVHLGFLSSLRHKWQLNLPC